MVLPGFLRNRHVDGVQGRYLQYGFPKIRGTILGVPILHRSIFCNIGPTMCLEAAVEVLIKMAMKLGTVSC